MTKTTNIKNRTEPDVKQTQFPEYNAETLAAIDDVDNNRNMSPDFDSMDDLMRSLHA